MDKKSQQSPISFTFMIIFTLIIFSLIGGQILGLFSLAAVLGNLSGLTLFIMSNFAVWLIIGIMLGIVTYFWRAKK
jgi:hypothetical protein